jgi:hypothetical protein
VYFLPAGHHELMSFVLVLGDYSCDRQEVQEEGYHLQWLY